MVRFLAVAVIAASVGALAATVVPSFAQSRPGPVRCVQVQQKPGALDDRFVEQFMNENVSAGRSNFETVQGISTVLCAW